MAVAGALAGCGASAAAPPPLADAAPDAAPDAVVGQVDERQPPDAARAAEPILRGDAAADIGASAARPDPITANANATTNITSTTGSGVYVVATEISAGAGMVPGMDGTTRIWRFMQPAAYLEYTLSTTVAGAYGLTVIFKATVAGGAADMLQNGQKIATVTFGSTVGAERQGGGGIPSCCGRAPTVLARLPAGASKIRIAFAPDSVPVDVHGIMIVSPKDPLPDYGKVLDVSASSPTTLQPDAVSDFFRLQYTNGAWQCVWSFCFIEYLVRPEKAGTYQVTLKYAASQKQAGRPGCAEFLVDYRSQGAVRLDSTTTADAAPVKITLPAGPSRLRIRNGDYFQGVFCWGAVFEGVVLRPG